MPPTLLVVSGLPAAGKTHLGTQLASLLGWPLVSKDDYKEILHDALPELTRAQAGPLSFEIMYHVAGVILAAGGHVVLETHFYRGLSEPKIMALAQQHSAELRQIFCHAPLQELKRRHERRVAAGERPHIHQAILYESLSPEASPQACWEPLTLPAPLLRLDTCAAVDVAQVAHWVRD